MTAGYVIDSLFLLQHLLLDESVLLLVHVLQHLVFHEVVLALRHLLKHPVLYEVVPVIVSVIPLAQLGPRLVVICIK